MHQDWLWDNFVAVVLRPAALRIEWCGHTWQGIRYTWDDEGMIDASLDVLSGGAVPTPVLLKL